MSTSLLTLDITTNAYMFFGFLILGICIPLAKIITEYIKDNWF